MCVCMCMWLYVFVGVHFPVFLSAFMHECIFYRFARACAFLESG